MKKLLKLAMFALALYSAAHSAIAVDHAPKTLHHRVQNVWELSMNVEDRRNETIQGFVFYAPDCAYCKKRETNGFNP